jgi:hypothetical protein
LESAPALAPEPEPESRKDIFAITIIKTLAVFAIIGVYYATGLV